jgi:EPS-associated MarR family transcriptional regulator
MSEKRQLDALRLLGSNSDLTQRDLAKLLGVSLGATNYCLRALVEKGWIKLENFQNNQSKLGYLYLLTPLGIAAKTKLTALFLKQKLREYEALEVEIEHLKSEIRRAK